MRFLIIRHGEPVYEPDILTQKGAYEAELLSHRMEKENIQYLYCSPVQRARLTCEPTARRLGMTPVILDWLREFPSSLPEKYSPTFGCPWNLPPNQWASTPENFDPVAWRTALPWSESNIPQVFDHIGKGIDTLFAAHGFHRDGHIYRAADGKANDETVALFCHMGLGLAMIAYLCHFPLPAVWHSLFLPTGSVTTVFMEEHPADPGAFLPRLVSIGDTSHLYVANEPISSSGLHSPLHPVDLSH